MLFRSEILKKTWLYKHFRNFLLWPKDLAYKLPLKRKFFLMMYQKNWMIDPCTSKRQKYWKKCGVNALGNFNVGADVYFDAQNAHYLTIEDGVWISSRCLILMHKRDISNYYQGDNYRNQPSVSRKVRICRGAAIGMSSIIMPGVTIGEGAVIGTGSVVVNDIPAWSVAVGNPARVIRTLKNRKVVMSMKERD